MRRILGGRQTSACITGDATVIGTARVRRTHTNIGGNGRRAREVSRGMADANGNDRRSDRGGRQMDRAEQSKRERDDGGNNVDGGEE